MKIRTIVATIIEKHATYFAVTVNERPARLLMNGVCDDLNQEDVVCLAVEEQEAEVFYPLAINNLSRYHSAVQRRDFALAKIARGSYDKYENQAIQHFYEKAAVFPDMAEDMAYCKVMERENCYRYKKQEYDYAQAKKNAAALREFNEEWLHRVFSVIRDIYAKNTKMDDNNSRDLTPEENENVFIIYGAAMWKNLREATEHRKNKEIDIVHFYRRRSSSDKIDLSRHYESRTYPGRAISEMIYLRSWGIDVFQVTTDDVQAWHQWYFNDEAYFLIHKANREGKAHYTLAEFIHKDQVAKKVKIPHKDGYIDYEKMHKWMDKIFSAYSHLKIERIINLNDTSENTEVKAPEPIPDAIIKDTLAIDGDEAELASRVREMEVCFAAYGRIPDLSALALQCAAFPDLVGRINALMLKRTPACDAEHPAARDTAMADAQADNTGADNGAEGNNAEVDKAEGGNAQADAEMDSVQAAKADLYQIVTMLLAGEFPPGRHEVTGERLLETAESCFVLTGNYAWYLQASDKVSNLAGGGFGWRLPYSVAGSFADRLREIDKILCPR